jgi:putative CocE/NonD family hydrolase
MTQNPKPEQQHGSQFGTYQGQGPQYEGMTTEALYIPMRDGVRIAVDVVLPKDLPPGTRIPTLLSQTRYWRAMELRAPFKWFLSPEALDPHFRDFQPFFTSHGYAIVVADVRGTGASSGIWSYPWSEESIEDAREIVDWIVAQPWSDGQVGAHGISYLGTTAEFLMVLDHPAVKAIMPMFSHPDAYLDMAFPGGIFHEHFVRVWGELDELLDRNEVPPAFGFMGRLVLKGVKPVDADRDGQLLGAAVREHEANGNAFELVQALECRDDRPEGEKFSIDDVTIHAVKEKVAGSSAVTCGWASWLDAGTADAALRRFLTFDNAQVAVIGAWEHGGRFNASPFRSPDAPASPTLPGQWREMLRFFDAHLNEGERNLPSEKVLFYYTMGEEAWKRTHTWPPEGTTIQRWYLAEDHELLRAEPTAEAGSDRYTVDFEATTGEYNRWWELAVLEEKTVIYSDRAEEDRRLLTYTSPPLDEEIEITGYPVVTLWVTSTEMDGAFYVYLEDVDPEGRVTYLTEGQLRALHRRLSTEVPPYHLQVPYRTFKRADTQPMVPGELTELTFGLQPTSALVRKGHRLRIAIAGHDEGTFVRIPAEGTPVITVARNKDHASFVDLPVVPRP